MKKTQHYLFSYGTLQLENVQLQNYNRKLKGFKDTLEGYKLSQIEITNEVVLEKSGKKFHPIAVPSKNKSDFIDGVIFEITENELLETDKYEVSAYKRVQKKFKSGNEAWVYILNKV